MTETTTTPDPRYGTVDRGYVTRLASTSPEDDGPIWMVNLMQYRDRADYADGREEDISGREADDRYAPLGPLAEVGADVVLFGDVIGSVRSDDAGWDRIAVVRYPTRRAFTDLQSLPEFQELHQHKDAGMQRTIVIGCQPIVIGGLDDQAEVDWDDVPYPPTESDPPVVLVQVLNYDDGVTATADRAQQQQRYQIATTLAAERLGVRVDGWFVVEGTVVGDGRIWDHVRFSTFPSQGALTALLEDPERRAVSADGFDPAVEDAVVLAVRPSINTLRESLNRAGAGSDE